MMKRTTSRIVVILGTSAALCAFLLAGGCRSDEGKPEQAASPEGSASSQAKGTPYYPGLIEEYHSILAEDPHNLATLIALGNALYDAGKWKVAIRYYERALEIDPHGYDVLTDMGTCYRNLAMPDKAIEIYERVITLEPGHQNALFNLGIVYGEDKKNYRNAITYLDHLLHVAPKHAQADMIRATLHQYKQALRKKTP